MAQHPSFVQPPLPPPTLRQVLFVVNPIAGGQDKTPFHAEVEQQQANWHFSWQLFETTGVDDAAQLLQQLQAYNPDAVVAAGGDGTINLVACALLHTGIPMAIVPMGSANGLATELGIPSNLAGALALLTNGLPHRLDAVQLNEHHLSLHLSDMGMNAEIVRRFEANHSRGMTAYVRQFFRELLHTKPSRFSLHVDGRSMRVSAHMVAFANARKYGTGAILNPQGKLDDGAFELCIIRPFPVWAFFTLLVRFFRGTLHHSQYVKIISCKEAAVSSDVPLSVSVDGELLQPTQQVRAKMLAGALVVLVPTSKP